MHAFEISFRRRTKFFPNTFHFNSKNWKTPSQFQNILTENDYTQECLEFFKTLRPKFTSYPLVVIHGWDRKVYCCEKKRGWKPFISIVHWKWLRWQFFAPFGGSLPSNDQSIYTFHSFYQYQIFAL